MKKPSKHIQLKILIILYTFSPKNTVTLRLQIITVYYIRADEKNYQPLPIVAYLNEKINKNTRRLGWIYFPSKPPCIAPLNENFRGQVFLFQSQYFKRLCYMAVLICFKVQMALVGALARYRRYRAYYIPRGNFIARFYLYIF